MMITFIRHGESEWNGKGIMQGIDDPALSSRGIEQAEALAERIEGIKGIRIFSSPLKRAYQTARIAAGRMDTDIEIIEDLMEIDIGRFSTLTWDQVKTEFPELFKKPDVNIWELFLNNRIPGQEPYEEMVQRIQRALAQIESSDSGKPPVLFSHGGFIRIFIAEQLGFRLDRKYFDIDNTSITIFDYETGMATFNRINDTRHLTSLSQLFDGLSESESVLRPSLGR